MSRAVDEHLFKRQGANKNSAEEKGFCPKKIIVARWPQWPAVEASNLTANADYSDSELCIFTTILPEALGLNAALSNTPSNFALRDSWVIDGASHVHVCNMRDRFESIEPCHQVLPTGDNSTVIEGWGISYAWITKADGSKKKMRMRSAYIPKF